VREIYEQLEGRHGLVECTGDAETCERADGCVTRDLWCEMYEACMGVLEDTDLAELADRARDRHDSAPIMYYI
jgi:DNA-binding IscR family transcriptional regulator